MMLMAQPDYLKMPLNPNEAASGKSSMAMPSLSSEDHGMDSTSFSNAPIAAEPTLYQQLMRLDAASLLRFTRYINVILATLQAFAGFFGLFDLARLDITSFLISVYVVIFALLMLAFECRFASMEPKIRELFGFLFTYRGRTAFIFMVGFMDFGIEGTFATLVGYCMCANAFLNCFIMMCHREFRNGTLSGDMDPTVSYGYYSQEAAEVVRNNPQMVSQAQQFAYHQVAQNPQYVTSIAQSYVSPNVINNANANASAAGGYVPPALHSKA